MFCSNILVHIYMFSEVPVVFTTNQSSRFPKYVNSRVVQILMSRHCRYLENIVSVFSKLVVVVSQIKILCLKAILEICVKNFNFENRIFFIFNVLIGSLSLENRKKAKTADLIFSNWFVLVHLHWHLLELQLQFHVSPDCYWFVASRFCQVCIKYPTNLIC